MKTITKTTTRYRCDVCGSLFGLAKDAAECEVKPVTQDKGVVVGDRIRVTTGQGAGERHIVEKRYIITRDWGHYVWKRYWHTVGLVAHLPGQTAVRHLTFDDYETIP